MWENIFDPDFLLFFLKFLFRSVKLSNNTFIVGTATASFGLTIFSETKTYRDFLVRLSEAFFLCSASLRWTSASSSDPELDSSLLSMSSNLLLLK